MTNITILSVGTIKEPYLSQGIKEYSKRITKFAKLDIIEVEEERLSSNPSATEIAYGVTAEGKRLISRIPKDSYLITLAIEGKLISSQDLAALIEKVNCYQTSKIVFIIGGSNGLDSNVNSMAHQSISLSLMTFPHQLIRLILLEQLYRAFTINHHIPYHK